MAFGLSFLPGANDQPGASGDPGGNVSGDRVQQAVRLLNLRLPRVQGAGAIAPAALLQSPGGQPGMDSAMNLQALQRLVQLMAGMGAVGFASPGTAPQSYVGPRVRPDVGNPGVLTPPGVPPSLGTGAKTPNGVPPILGIGPRTPSGVGNLPPGGPAPGWQNPAPPPGRLITPKGPGNLPPNGPAPGWQNPKKPKLMTPKGPGNLPPNGPAPGWKNPRGHFL